MAEYATDKCLQTNASRSVTVKTMDGEDEQLEATVGTVDAIATMVSSVELHQLESQHSQIAGAYFLPAHSQFGHHHYQQVDPSCLIDLCQLPMATVTSYGDCAAYGPPTMFATRSPTTILAGHELHPPTLIPTSTLTTTGTNQSLPESVVEANDDEDRELRVSQSTTLTSLSPCSDATAVTTTVVDQTIKGDQRGQKAQTQRRRTQSQYVVADAAVVVGNDDELKVCEWFNCHNSFTDMVKFVKHIEDEHVNVIRDASDDKNKFLCRWSNCKRNEAPFNAKYKLLIHMRVHSGEKPHACDARDCGKSFSRHENLKIHKRSHTGEKPYKCKEENCSKSFTNSSDRIKHHKTHNNPKPYACTAPDCTKRYTDPSSLRKHSRTHKPKQQQTNITTQTTTTHPLQQQQQQQQQQAQIQNSSTCVQLQLQMTQDSSPAHAQQQQQLWSQSVGGVVQQLHQQHPIDVYLAPSDQYEQQQPQHLSWQHQHHHLHHNSNHQQQHHHHHYQQHHNHHHNQQLFDHDALSKSWHPGFTANFPQQTPTFEPLVTQTQYNQQHQTIYSSYQSQDQSASVVQPGASFVSSTISAASQWNSNLNSQQQQQNQHQRGDIYVEPQKLNQSMPAPSFNNK